MNEHRFTPDLYRHIREIAASFGRDPMDTDDICSEILEKIWLLSSDEDSRSRILTRARWVALNHVRDNARYGEHLATEDELRTFLADDKDEDETDELFQETVTPEDHLLAAERKADIKALVHTLSATDQSIVRLLKDGFQPTEIASKMAVSRSAISQRMSDIALRFAGASGGQPTE